MALPTVIDFEPENDFGGSISQSQSRFRTFLAHVAPDPDDGIDGAIEALYAHDEGLQRGAVHPANSSLFASEFDVDLAAKGVNRDGHYLFRVLVTYTSNQYEATKTEQQVQVEQESPLSDPVQWRSSFRIEMVPADKDIHGNPILNSAGDDYDPKPLKKKAVWTHAATVNMAVVPTSITSLANAVNTDSILVRGVACEPETVQITGLDIPDVQTRNGVSFVPVTLVYEVDPDGFDLSLLSMGYKAKNLATGELCDIYISPPDEAIEEAEENGDPKPVPQRASYPCMLDEYGVWIKKPNSSNVHFTEHEMTKKVPFAGLPGIVAA